MGNEPQKVLEGEGVQLHPRLGNVRVTQARGSSKEEPLENMEIYCRVDDQIIYQKWVEKVKEIDSPQIREIILLPNREKYQIQGFCGTNGLIEITYEHFPFLLSTEIENRAKLPDKFHEIEIWYIMYFMVLAGAKMEKLHDKIGDVNPGNIFINDYGEIRMLSTRSLPTQLDNFQKFSSSPESKVFLAPQQLNQTALTVGEYPKEVDKSRAQVFSMGAVLLSLGVLEEVHKIYNDFEINQREYSKYLQDFQLKYSEKLFEVVKSMLCLDPKKRKSCSSIFKQLKVHEEDILNLTPLEEWTK